MLRENQDLGSQAAWALMASGKINLTAADYDDRSCKDLIKESKYYENYENYENQNS